MSRLVITGAIGSGAPNRLEIHDFVKNEKYFSLYIQALRMCRQSPAFVLAMLNLFYRGDAAGYPEQCSILLLCRKDTRPTLRTME